jgi:TonB-linked SusC/RagA family outer membrane protein
MRRFTVLLVILFGMGLQISYAQSKNIQGTVQNDEGEALPFVTVSIKGTNEGAITNQEGEFKLEAAPSDSLKVSFVGMQTQVIPVGNNTTFDIVLQPASTSLDEVVVVAYGTKRKRDIISSVSSVSAEEIEHTPNSSFENIMQGKTPGLVMSSGARAGNVNSIRIRGTSSLSASSQPLFVIDGVPQTDYRMGYTGDYAQVSPLSNLNPNDIESIQVLKDASASALYGSRASNGVILITTKKGKGGKTKINFSSQAGYQEPTNFIDVLNGEQYTELLNEAYANATGGAVEQVLGSPEDAVNTDWIDETMRQGLMQQYNLSASGGNEKTQFYSSFAYSDDEGYTKGNNFQRVSGRLNVDHMVNEKLKLNANLAVSRVINDRVSGSNSISSASTLGLLQFPNIPVMGDGSDFYGPEDEFYQGPGVNIANGFSQHNLVQDLDESFHESTTYKPSISVGANYEIIDNLTFNTDFSTEYIDMTDDIFWGLNGIDGGAQNGVLQNLSFTRLNYLTTNRLDYTYNLNEVHNFTFMAGYSYQKTVYDNFNVTGENFPSNDLHTMNSAASVSSGGGNTEEVAFESYFGRVTYDFMNKYLAEFTLRTDGSSRFGSEERYAVFPAGSLGWIVSDEDFMKDIEFINFLKIRTGYGITGNSEILSSATAADANVLNYPALGLYNAGFGYGDEPGLAPIRLANPNLRWEQTAQFNIGVNFSMLNNRLELEADYYNKVTTDLLLNLDLPATSGYTSYTQNIGELTNKGVEFGLTSRNLVNDFKWTTDFNIAFNQNEIKDIQGRVISNEIARAMEGEPIGVFYTVEYAGVDPETGDALFIDDEGNETTNYSDDYRKIMGDPNPDFTGGLTNTFSYKGFDLRVFMQFSYGGDVYRSGSRFVETNMGSVWNQQVTQLDRWQEPGDITDVPQARLTTNGSQPSSRYIEDGSYLRFKNITFGYNLPKNVIEGSGFNNVRLYAQAQNWITVTDYSGNDPEVTSNGIANVGQGITFLEAPTPRMLLFGIDVSL